MKDRIKAIRKSFPEYGKTQESFAKFLGISKQNLSSYEIGRRVPSDAVVQLICEKCNISKQWLREGIGEMKIEDCQEERYASNVAKLQRTDDETIIRWANAIAEASPEVLKQVEEFMKKILGLDEE